tara:strand:+ start:158 stop:331 length:174 start_codon:yes stop_codon:yes gene_type:complete
MFGKIFSAVRGFGSATNFESYLSNLLNENGGQAPTIEEARKQYRVIVSERSSFIDRY